MVPAEFQASPNAHYVCLLIQINDQNHRTKVALTASTLRLAIAIQRGRGASGRTLVSATDWLIFGWTKASRLPSPCCLPTQFNSGWREDQMLLILWFVALVAAGDLLSYLVGLFVEYEWGSYPSLVVFLAMYFITLWVAWRIAVWLTRPKPASTSSEAA